MKRLNLFFSYLFQTFLFLCFLQSNVFANELSDYKKYKIKVPQSLIKDSCGFYPAIGSSIKFNRKLKDGSLEFFMITDRGPNQAIEKENKVIFFCPSFSPKIVRMIVTPDGEARVKDYVSISNKNKAVTGIDTMADASIKMVTDQMKPIKPGVFGLDTESIAVLKDGNFIVGDEYYPSLNIISKDGKLLKTIVPGSSLPRLIKYNFNRGFEAVTVAPNGKVYAFLEGPLNIKGETIDTAQFIRLFEIDLTSGLVKTYAYKFDRDEYNSGRKAKIGDMSALNNNQFLIVEQGKGKAGLRNIIYKIDIKDATDISNLKLPGGKELEYGALKDLKAIKFIKKSLVLNPRKYGWKNEKLEGLSVIDANTIAIVNDNDFGIIGHKEVKVKCNADSKDQQCSRYVPIIDEDSKETDLWIMTLKNSF